ncbi:MAG: hypothetical protein K0Q61_3597 [Rhodococcus erythropolis]|nr:hypothetical protein [Rhodococcus erythropolis]
MVKVFSPAKIRSTTTARTSAANAARANQLCFDEGRSVRTGVVIEPPPAVRLVGYSTVDSAVPVSSGLANYLPSETHFSSADTL